MKIKDIAEQIEKIVPLHLAQDWDNVGLLVGDAEKQVRRILLAIDVTKPVLAEAVKQKAELIISYHPVIWDGLKNITATGSGGIVYELARAGIGVFSVHTALDVVEGGVNDELARIVGIVEAKPIGDYVQPPGEFYKLTVFVPVDSVDKVAEAIFSAGAGKLGNYSHCGFMTEGEGSFLPLKGAKPAIGRKGRLEKVREMRFESIVPADKLADCISAMKKAHPYEMPAFDCYRLYNETKEFGLGRIGDLKKAASVGGIVEKLKKATGAKAVGFVGKENRMVKRAAVCAGSCGKLINSVIADGADLYVTGELKHHLALAAQEAGLSCVCLSHTVSERFILKKFAKRLQEQMPDMTIKISRKDTEPFNWKNI